MDFYTRAKELADSVNVPQGVNQTLCSEFDLRSDEVTRRFKSFFGVTPRSYIINRLTPSKQDADRALLVSNDVHEFKERLGIASHKIWKGFLDRHYGVSTFAAAKAKAVLDTPVVSYTPTAYDNRAILASQVLGDGTFDTKRNALRIDQKADHSDYLFLKVALLKQAYPFVPDVNAIKLRHHPQGHDYVAYYAGGLHKHADFLNQNRSELVRSLTPLGWLLWYLDDGGYYVSSSGQHIIMLACTEADVRQQAIKELASYGHYFTDEGKTYIFLKDSVGVAKFMHGMIWPFYNMIPECMMYKCDMKV